MVTKQESLPVLENQLNFIQHIKYEHLVAGIAGGLISTLVLHPLDLVKIRFQVNDGKQKYTPTYKGIGNAFKTIFQKEGVYGLYRGVTPNLWGAGSSWGLYFLFYNAIKTWIQGGNTSMSLGPGTHLLAASEAGILTLFLTNPIWVVKTRLCLQYSGIAVPKNSLYKGMIDALRKTYRNEGFVGYYRGLLPGIFGVSHGAVQFMVYEEFKKKYCDYYNAPITSKLGTVEYLTFAAVSKIIAVATTYPYQVVRSRMQNQYNSYASVTQCVQHTWMFEGWRGFYKGLATNLIRVTPATMITFVTYENISHLLLS